MRKLKKKVKSTAAVLVGMACAVMLSAAETSSVAVEAAWTGEAVICENTQTGIGDAVFENEEDGDLSIVLTEEAIEIDNGASFDPLTYIEEIRSAAGEQPVLRMAGSVNTAENGTYLVQYEVLDQLGHTSAAELSVTVRYSEAQLQAIEEQKAAEEAAAQAAAEAAAAEEAADEESYEEEYSSANVSLESLSAYDTGTVYGMVEAINAVRASYGLYAFSYADGAGFSAAAIRAQECTYYLSHTRPDGSDYSTALDECGVSYGYDSEIIAAYGSSVADNLNWWLSDYGHRVLVLSTSASTIAVGYSGGVWVAEIY